MSEAKIKVYKGPAGGWGALKSVATQLVQHHVVAKGGQTLLHANQPDGFDCPGCAWPESSEASKFRFCENGVKAIAAEITPERATPDVLAQHTVTALREWSDHDLEALGRLTHPMAYDAASDRYQPISWDQAFATIGRHLRALDHPDQALFYTSGRTSNEAAFLYQLFIREFGTNNLPDCSNMCHEPSGAGMTRSVGVGKGTVSLHDFSLADAIFVFGHNPGTNHPRMLGELSAASRRGARIVSVNPLRERGLERFTDPQDKLEMALARATPISSHYVQPQVGGDLALLRGLCKRVIELDDQARRDGLPRVLDGDFIARHTQGFEAFAEALRAQDWAALEAASGLRRAQMEATAAVYVGAERVIACWGMGITQHEHGVANVEMIAALLMLRGHIGRPGAGLCPVRGHSNVQGDRTMGINEKPSAEFLRRLGAEFGFSPPTAHGHNVVSAIAAMQAGQARVFIGLGGNFAAATPDTHATWAALRQCALTAHITTKLNRSHVVQGGEALILPCLGRTERDLQAQGPQSVTVEDSMSMVHLSTGSNAPASEHLLSEPAIVAGMALATLTHSRTPWRELVADYGRIRERIARVIPGFENFNQRVAVPGGFRLPNAAAERRWQTPSGKAQFSRLDQHPALLPGQRAQAAGDEVLVLSTLRAHDQYNTTIYAPNDRYRGITGLRRVLFIAERDLQRLGLRAGEWVDIEGVERAPGEPLRQVQGFQLVAYELPAGSVAAYYPETNPLVPLHSVAVGAGTPASKSVLVRLRRSAKNP